MTRFSARNSVNLRMMGEPLILLVCPASMLTTTATLPPQILDTLNRKQAMEFAFPELGGLDAVERVCGERCTGV